MTTVNNEVLAKAVAQANSVDEMIAAFADQGIEITAQELGQAAREALSETGDELTESDLETVSGGGSYYSWATQKAKEIIVQVATEIGRGFIDAAKKLFGF